MEEAKKYIIEIRGDAGEDSSSISDPEKTSSDKKALEKQEKETYAKLQLAMQLVNNITNSVSSVAIYSVNKNLSLNDDYIGQRNLAIAKQKINKASSFLTNTVSGALLGAKTGTGVWGIAIGAVIGASTDIVSTLVENYTAMSNQEIEIRMSNAQLDFTRQRAGYSTQAASIGEDL